MDRRTLLRLSLAGGGGLLLMGHSPYRQWYVYRMTHLILVTSDADPGAAAIGEALARAIAARLPESKATAAQARTATDIVKLLRSHQLPLALLPGDQALAAVRGTGPFLGEGPVALRALAAFGERLLVALDDLPADHARQIVDALADYPVDHGAVPIPLHPGVASGEASPSLPTR